MFIVDRGRKVSVHAVMPLGGASFHSACVILLYFGSYLKIVFGTHRLPASRVQALLLTPLKKKADDGNNSRRIVIYPPEA